MSLRLRRMKINCEAMLMSRTPARRRSGWHGTFRRKMPVKLTGDLQQIHKLCETAASSKVSLPSVTMTPQVTTGTEAGMELGM